jgi:hypothetical protein
VQTFYPVAKLRPHEHSSQLFAGASRPSGAGFGAISTGIIAEPVPTRHPVCVEWSRIEDLIVAERPGACPSCAHPAASTSPGWLDRFLQLTPLPARCAEITDVDHVMWFTTLCHCRHPFHGS